MLLLVLMLALALFLLLDGVIGIGTSATSGGRVCIISSGSSC
jgi:hypothetical protein